LLISIFHDAFADHDHDREKHCRKWCQRHCFGGIRPVHLFLI